MQTHSFRSLLTVVFLVWITVITIDATGRVSEDNLPSNTIHVDPGTGTLVMMTSILPDTSTSLSSLRLTNHLVDVSVYRPRSIN